MSHFLAGKYDVIIIGAGAAGLFCAFNAAQRGRRVALLEHNETVGKKIGISGGGRCNFTNIHATAENYISGNRDFCKSALACYSPWNFIELVEKHGIAYHEKKLGQQFCDGSSRAIIDLLLTECREAGVTILTSCRIEEVTKLESFHLITSRGSLQADSLVIATGGLSFAKLGATDFGYRIAKQFGITVTPLRPGLVPLTFENKDKLFCNSLAGVALPVCVKHNKTTFKEALLFTHRGVSGPAILQISSYWKEGDQLFFDLLPEKEIAEQLAAEKKSGHPFSSPEKTEIRPFAESLVLQKDNAPQRKRAARVNGCKSGTLFSNLLQQYLPRRFAEEWSKRHALLKPVKQYNDREFQNILELLHHWPMSFSGTEGYPKAEVTLGGIDTRELSSRTMESRRVPGLYFIGEVIDVTGWLGGYNFQWAWASAHAAAKKV
ncbi:MAG: NAD(P)/FAD-dependent oxidoreductase [Chthoniobacterales bacterium]